MLTERRRQLAARIDDRFLVQRARTALATVILVDVWLYTPFVVLLMQAALRSIFDELREAQASTAGFRRWITVPLSRRCSWWSSPSAASTR